MNNFKFKTKPYEHQLEVFNKFKNSEYFALFMDLGTGKSKVTIDIASYKFYKKEINAIMLVAPNGVNEQWLTEQMPIHCNIEYTSFLWNSSKRTNKYYAKRLDLFLNKETDKLKVFSINVEAFQSSTIIPFVEKFIENTSCCVVIDESTKIKNPDARRTKAIHKLKGIVSRCILTGTPVTKSPIDIYSQFEFLLPNYFDCNYFIFRHRYALMIKGNNPYSNRSFQKLIDEKEFNIIKHKLKKIKESRGVSGLQQDDYETVATIMGISEANVKYIEKQSFFTRFKNLDQLKEKIKDDIFTAKKEECLDLPEKIYEHIYIDFPKEQRRIYDNLKNQLLAQYENEELTVVNKISLTIRLMQICGGFFSYKNEHNKQMSKQIGSKNIKIERLIEDLEEIGEDQIIVWANFIPELELLYFELSKIYTCELYYGRTDKLKREKIIQDFKTNKFKIFIANPQTAAFGLNLQNCTIQYYFSNNFRTELRIQAEDRSHRIGVKSICIYKDIIIKNSIDEKVFKVLSEGKNLNDFFKGNSLKEILK